MKKTVLQLAAAGLIVLFAKEAALAETLFKIVTVKDDVIVGLNDAELAELGGDAGGIAKAIASGARSRFGNTGRSMRQAASARWRRSPGSACLRTARFGSSLTSSRSRCCRMNRGALGVAVVVAALAAIVTVTAHAGSGSDNEDGQRPPAAQDNAPPEVQNEAPPAPPKECLTDKSGFRSRDGQNEFYMSN